MLLNELLSFSLLSDVVVVVVVVSTEFGVFRLSRLVTVVVVAGG